MHLLRDISINGKLKIIIVITSSVALLVACAAFVTYDLILTRQSMASDLSTLAKVIGANSTAALAFGDNDSAREVLSALSAKQPVVRARLFLPDDTVFAEYLRNAALDPALPEFEHSVSGSRFEGEYLVACEPIVLDGETVGMIRIVSDLNALNHRVGQNARALAMVLLGSLLVVLVISSRLQRTISGPISHLAKTVRAVSLEKDYNIRAVKTSRDELGMLIDGFNEMLTQIQERDVELQNARDQLERRVEERTAELQQEIGERKQAEETLRESEELFRSLAESVSAAIYIYREGRYVYLNAAAELITGYTRDELMEMEPGDIVHPDFREQIKARTELRLNGEEVPSRTEFKILTKNGEPRWLDLSASLIRFNGEPAVLATAFDITERRGWEDALRESEEKYRTILESIQEGYYEVDLRGNLTFFNDSLCRIVGSPRERLMGLNNREYADAESARNLYAAFNQVFRTGEPLEEFHNQIVTQEGVEKFLESSILLRRNSTGQISGFRGIIRDITERKRAEEALRRSEERNRALVDAMPDAMARLSREGVYLDVRIPTGFPRDAKAQEAVGLSLSDVLSREVADKSLEGIKRALATGEMQSLEFEVLVGDQRRVREARIVVCGNDEVISLIRDITEHKQIEEMNVRRTRQIALRADVGSALADRSADLRQTLDYCTQAVVRHLDAAFARIWTLNSELNVLELQASAGMYTHINGAHARIPVGAFKIGLIAQERQPHISNDVQSDPRVGDKEWAKREGMIAFAGYPLVVGHKLVGVMAMFGRHKLTEDTLNSLGSISDIISQAIERKQAEQALRESEERYKTLFESATDGIMIFEAEGEQAGRIVAANPAAAENTGYTVEELMGLTIDDLQPPEQAELAAQDRHQILPGEHVTSELLRRRKDGTTFPIEVNAGLLMLGGKRFILSFARDLTQRKQIEKEMAMLAHAVRSIQECVSITDNDHVVLFVNDAFVRTYGFERDEVVGKKLIDLVRVDRSFNNGDPLGPGPPSEGWEGELLNRRKDGTHFTIHLTVSPIHDDSGRTIALAGVSQDITERKKIEKEVTMLAHAMRSINEFIVIADLDGTIIFVNEAAVKGFGYEREEAIGHNVTMLHSTRNAPEFVNKILRSARAGGWEGEKLSRRKDGTEFPTYLSASEIQDDSGRAIALVGVSQDITERKRAIEELKNAKEAAESASRAKSEFLANMSHEIRTPMNGIIGMTELALDTDLSPEQREYLGMVKTSAGSLLTVINDILDFSKIEAGKLDLDAVDFRLRDSFAETMRPLAIRAHQKKLELAVEIPPDVPDALVGDQGRLRQILVNLVGNAIKFTEDGEIVVSVETKWETDDGVWLHFSVRDTGIGIPPEKQQLIFSPFTQADGSTSRTYGGTGLGLAISTRFVGMMGGEMWVESEAGHGSTFHFTAQFGLQKDLTPAHIPVNPANLWNLRVLIVDDNATNRRILEQVLTHWNMKPSAVEGGEAALSILKRAADAGKPFPLVLLDAYMPGMDGFSVAARIKETRELAGTTIMMLTSNDQRNDAARCRELGVAAFLIKPVMQSNLFDAIMTAMGAPAPAEEAAFPAPSTPADSSRQCLHILLAEDNTVNQKLAMRLLEKQGHTVVLAENGREAIAAFEGGIFDVVLMDVQMPEVNGFEATTGIREKEKLTGGHVPIIAMTAHALKGDRERCLAAGMDDYVSKPIRADELAKAIENQVGVSNAAFAEKPERTLDEVFDAAALLARLDGDTELLRYIVELFLEELPRLMSQVRDAVMLEDSDALERAAHTLRGSVGNFHAGGVVELALGLETMGREGSLTGAKKTMAMLEREVERLRPALIALGKEQLIYEGSDR
ncbi:MAG: PAS domain S-box protein [Acidobacteriota bacterium]